MVTFITWITEVKLQLLLENSIKSTDENASNFCPSIITDVELFVMSLSATATGFHSQVRRVGTTL